MYEIIIFNEEQYLYKPSEHKWISMAEPNYELDMYNDWVANGNEASIVEKPTIMVEETVVAEEPAVAEESAVAEGAQ